MKIIYIGILLFSASLGAMEKKSNGTSDSLVPIEFADFNPNSMNYNFVPLNREQHEQPIIDYLCSKDKNFEVIVSAHKQLRQDYPASSEEDTKNVREWTIIHKQTQQLIGSCGYALMPENSFKSNSQLDLSRVAVMGYLANLTDDNPDQKTSYTLGKELITTFIPHLFDKLNYTFIVLTIVLKDQKFLEQFGFKRAHIEDPKADELIKCSIGFMTLYKKDFIPLQSDNT